MKPRWDYVKKITLWHYEDLIKKLSVVMGYPAIWQAYNHDMDQAVDFARRLFPDKDIHTGEFPAGIIHTIENLKSAGISDWGDLLSKVNTRAEFLEFITGHYLVFEEVVDVLNYLLRWALPFQTASRELLEHENSQEMRYYDVLKRHRLMMSFDVLELGSTIKDRHALARHTGLPLRFVTALVHRADMARLPYVRRKTILPLCGAGYDTLARIAAADMVQMKSDLNKYFQYREGKSWANYQSVILLEGLVTCARALPPIVEE